MGTCFSLKNTTPSPPSPEPSDEANSIDKIIESYDIYFSHYPLIYIMIYMMIFLLNWKKTRIKENS